MRSLSRVLFFFPILVRFVPDSFSRVFPFSFLPILGTGISDLIMFHEKVWFQNRRAEEKKALTKKGPSPTSPSSSTGVTTASAATVPDTAVTTDASPCPEATPEGLADPVPPPPDTSTMTEIEPQTFDRSTSTLQSPPWRPESEPITEMFDSSGNISERMLYRQLPTPPRSAYASPTYPLDVPSPHPGPCNIARRRRPQHPEPPTNDPP